jgi:hypothetical protein
MSPSYDELGGTQADRAAPLVGADTAYSMEQMQFDFSVHRPVMVHVVRDESASHPSAVLLLGPGQHAAADVRGTCPASPACRAVRGRPRVTPTDMERP